MFSFKIKNKTISLGQYSLLRFRFFNKYRSGLSRYEVCALRIRRHTYSDWDLLPWGSIHFLFVLLLARTRVRLLRAGSVVSLVADFRGRWLLKVLCLLLLWLLPWRLLLFRVKPSEMVNEFTITHHSQSVEAIRVA